MQNSRNQVQIIQKDLQAFLNNAVWPCESEKDVLNWHWKRRPGKDEQIVHKDLCENFEERVSDLHFEAWKDEAARGLHP